MPRQVLRAGFRQNGFFADFYFWAAGFFCGFSRRIFSPHFCGKKCPEKSSRKIPGKILQHLYNKNPPTHFCRLPRAKIHEKFTKVLWRAGRFCPTVRQFLFPFLVRLLHPPVFVVNLIYRVVRHHAIGLCTLWHKILTYDQLFWNIWKSYEIHTFFCGNSLLSGDLPGAHSLTCSQKIISQNCFCNLFVSEDTTTSMGGYRAVPSARRQALQSCPSLRWWRASRMAVKPWGGWGCEGSIAGCRQKAADPRLEDALQRNIRSCSGKPNQRKGQNDEKFIWISPIFVNSGVFFLRKTSTIHIELLFRNAPAKNSWTDLSLVWFAGPTPENRTTFNTV